MACANGSRPDDDSGARADERAAMVAQQVEERGIRDPRVLEAMRRVPRHAFVPEEMRPFAYDDSPLPLGAGQTISQPYIVARMTAAVDVQDGERVLDVGTGSGYQAAVLAELTPHVFTIEIVDELARTARASLDAAGYGRVVSTTGDGWAGWPEHAPFDAIVVAAAPDVVPPALVEQLAPGGRLCLPVGPRDETQHLLLVEKRADGSVVQRMLELVRFVPMTGGDPPGT
ncbi:MAG: protein-L-isoaspartate(D-aspartate) O-methyltransferase [Planctomycetes bacterium]|nr:protein-L-isoaspartate(D-aspartate) O-methyltransferase [Planctomycetota bacterium]